jgi:hypothetical protein
MSNYTDLQNKDDSLVKQQDLLSNQQSSQDKITALLEQSAQSLICGPDCQKQKITEELKQKYLNSQTNLQTAPINLETTKKNYYIFSEGRPFYENMLEEELKQKADKISELITESFNDEVSDALTMNQYYDTAIINSKYTKELLKDYSDKNVDLKLKLRNRHGDILTNDRKTFYETDALERLQLWYKFWWYIYYMLIIVFVIAIIGSPSQLSFIKKSIILILLVFYPYYINYISKLVYNFYMSIYNNLPKNVYNNL